jgi:hypothetical protein
VNALPSVPTISNTLPLIFCDGANTVLSSSSPTGNQWLLNGNIITGATGQSLTVTTAGSYSVRVTNANNCSSTSAATTVTVNALPSIPTISNSRPLTFCVGDNTVLSSSSATGNQWLLNGNIITGATGQTLTVTTAGSYSVRVTNAGNCSMNSASLGVIVNTIPSLPTITNSGSIPFCNGDSIILTSSSTINNQWMLNGNFINGATGQNLTVKSPGTYSVRVINGLNCTATSANRIVTVNPSPNIPVVGNTRPLTFCTGDNTVLISSEFFNNQWLLNGNVISGATGQILNVQSSGSYAVRVRGANGCTSTSATVTTVVNPIPATPTITRSTTLPICSGDSMILTSSSSINNQWLLNGNIVNGATSQNLVVRTQGNYTVRVINNSACFATSSSVTVNVLPSPNTPSVGNTRPLTFCSGDNTVLVSSEFSNNQWLLNGNLISGATGQILNVQNAGSYNVRVTNIFGCSATSSPINVVVNPTPSIPTISNNRPLTFCAGDNTILSSSSNNGNQWLLNGNVINGANTQTITVTTSGSYSVRVTNASNCSAISSPTTVTVQSIPVVPTISNTRPLTFCTGDSTILTSSSSTGNQWLLNGIPVVGGSSQTFIARNSGLYSVRVTNASGCSVVSNNISVTNNSTVGTGLLFRDSLICKATQLRVTAQAVSPVSFNWTGVRTGFTSNLQSVNISNADMYRVRITLANGCIVNDSINLRNTVDTAIRARIVMSSQAFVNQNVAIANITNPRPQTQNWVFPPGASVISQTDTMSRIRFNNTGTYQVILNNTSYNVCKSSDTARIVITSNDAPNITSSNTTILRNVTVSPNPTTGIANVSIQLNRPGRVSMRLYNFNGTLLSTKIINNTSATVLNETIDISNQPSNSTCILIVQTDISYEVRSILKR